MPFRVTTWWYRRPETISLFTLNSIPIVYSAPSEYKPVKTGKNDKNHLWSWMTVSCLYQIDPWSVATEDLLNWEEFFWRQLDENRWILLILHFQEAVLQKRGEIFYFQKFYLCISWEPRHFHQVFAVLRLISQQELNNNENSSPGGDFTSIFWFFFLFFDSERFKLLLGYLFRHSTNF